MKSLEPEEYPEDWEEYVEDNKHVDLRNLDIKGLCQKIRKTP